MRNSLQVGIRDRSGCQMAAVERRQNVAVTHLLPASHCKCLYQNIMRAFCGLLCVGVQGGSMDLRGMVWEARLGGAGSMLART